MLRQINDWTEKNSPLLQTEAWEGAGPVPCADCSDGFHQKIEYFWLLFNHAGRCIVQLQEIFIPIFQFQFLRIYPIIFTSSQSLITCWYVQRMAVTFVVRQNEKERLLSERVPKETLQAVEQARAQAEARAQREKAALEADLNRAEAERSAALKDLSMQLTQARPPVHQSVNYSCDAWGYFTLPNVDTGYSICSSVHCVCCGNFLS
jgi:hypothetical protein